MAQAQYYRHQSVAAVISVPHPVLSLFSSSFPRLTSFAGGDHSKLPLQWSLHPSSIHPPILSLSLFYSRSPLSFFHSSFHPSTIALNSPPIANLSPDSHPIVIVMAVRVSPFVHLLCHCHGRPRPRLSVRPSVRSFTCCLNIP